LVQPGSNHKFQARASTPRSRSAAVRVWPCNRSYPPSRLRTPVASTHPSYRRTMYRMRAMIARTTSTAMAIPMGPPTPHSSAGLLNGGRCAPPGCVHCGRGSAPLSACCFSVPSLRPVVRRSSSSYLMHMFGRSWFLPPSRSGASQRRSAGAFVSPLVPPGLPVYVATYLPRSEQSRNVEGSETGRSPDRKRSPSASPSHASAKVLAWKRAALSATAAAACES
jgi:hypothetical protein